MLSDIIENKNELNSELIEWNNNHAGEDFPDAMLYDTGISPIARYAVMPNPDYDFKSLDTNSSPHPRMSINCYDTTSYILYIVYSGSDGVCYVGTARLAFNEKHEVDVENTTWRWLNNAVYDDFETAYEAFQSDDAETLVFVEVEAPKQIQATTSESDVEVTDSDETDTTEEQ